MKSVKVKINGMTCSSCEVLIERRFKTISGIEKVKVSHAKGEAELMCDREPTMQELQEAVQADGYTLVQVNEQISTNVQQPLSMPESKKNEYIAIGKIFFITVAFYIVLRRFDILPSFGISEGMSYGIVFLIGLVAAASTCMAVSGGLLLAVTAKYHEMYPNLTRVQRFKPHIYFNIGRILSYTVLGGLVGALGSFIVISPRSTGILTVIASVAMIIIGLQMLKIFPWLNRFQIKMPKSIAHKMYDTSGNGKQHPLAPFLFGASSFFFPCGFTQALQLYVLSTGSFAVGALTMLAFSLGTLPGLLSIGAISSVAKGAFQRDFLRAAAIIVVLLGIFNISNGLVLAGADVDINSLLSNDGMQQPAGTTVNLVDGKQVVEMAVNGLDYSPSSFTIVEGIPVEWRIDGRAAQGCAQVISVPKLGITEYLPRDTIKIIAFTPQETGRIDFSCSMGMAGPGTFTVVPNSKSGSTKVAPSEAAEDNQPQTEGGGESQKLSMEISRERGFYPNAFTVKNGIPVELEIDAKIQLGGCMSTLVIPEYNVAHLLKLGKSVLRFTPTREGRLPFTCSMGSKMGEFIVVA